MKFTSQQQKALNIRRDFIVNAGAGSGKTTILVERYLRILASDPDVSPQNIVAITYTEKAAAEIKQRIVDGLHGRINDDRRGNEKLYSVLRETDELRISTIHSFCQRILRENALVSGFLPETTIIISPEKEALFDRMFWYFFQQIPPQGRAATSIKKALNQFDLYELKKIFAQIYFQRSIYLPYLKDFARLAPERILDFWRKIEREHYQQLFAGFWRDPRINSELQKFQSWLADQSGKTAASLSSVLSSYLALAAQSPPDMAALIPATRELIRPFFTREGQLKVHAAKLLSRCHEADVIDETVLVPPLQRLFPHLIAGENQGESNKELAETQAVLSNLLLEFFRRLDDEKRKLRVRDFEDLLLETESLLKRRFELRRKLREQIRWILVDEFQDTDPVQDRIISLLTAEEAGLPQTNLFLVGDPKQSIFAFRKADVTILQDRIAGLLESRLSQTEDSSGGNNGSETLTGPEKRGLILLPDNFRSLPPLIRLYNSIFERIFARESRFDVDFSPLAAARSDAGSVSHMELRLIEVEPDTSAMQAAALQVREMAAIIGSLKSGASGDERESSGYRFGDIAVLVRDRRRLPEMEREFSRLNIPYEVIKGKGFYQKQEILDIYSMLKAVTDYDDSFSLVAALRTPYLGLSDEGLFYLSRFSAAKYADKLQQAFQYLSTGDITLFGGEFQSFLAQRNEKAAFSEHDFNMLKFLSRHWERWQNTALQGNFSLLLNDLTTTLNIPAVMAAGEGGAQKVANLRKLTEYAYQFQQRSSGRVSDFLESLQTLIEGAGDEGEAPPAESREDRVQIMTIHAAKGLEFPVVLLPLLDNTGSDKNKFYSDKHAGLLIPDKSSSLKKCFIFNYFKYLSQLERLAEEKRLFYVAATRARDQIFFMGALEEGEELPESSLKWLLGALGGETGFSPERIKQIYHDYGLKVVKKTSASVSQAVFSGFPPRHAAVPAATPSPETILAYSSKVAVPWPRMEYSATQLMIFRENPERYIRHFYYRDAELEPGGEYAGPGETALLEERPSPQAELAFDGARGLIWGSLLHRILENFHLRNLSEEAAAIGQAIRQYQIPQNEAAYFEKEIQNILRRFRATELGQFLLKTEQRSEVRASLKLKTATLVGVFDRVFRNDEGIWEVLDFKTNRVAKSGLKSLVEKYRLQMEYYGLLLGRLFPEQKTFPVRLFFLDPMQEFRFVFQKKDLSAIAVDLQKTLESIITYEKEFFGVND